MSDSEYDSDESSGSDGTDTSSASECSFASLEAAMTTLYEQMAVLDSELEGVHSHLGHIEKPVAEVAVSTLAQPRILESAPFRQTQFKIRSTAQLALGLPPIATFAEIGQSLRTFLLTRKEEAEKLWGTTEFLGALQHLEDIVE